MIAALAWLLLAADAPDFDPASGYRVAHYRAVVPTAPDGVERVPIDAAIELARSRRAILIDVTPAEGAIRDASSGRWRLATPHETIPGAHWFPEAGRGVLGDGIEPWLLSGVGRLAARHPKRPIIVFCLADCWMSWNAALRLHRAGFRDVRWFAEGNDGWREARLRLVTAKPE